VRARKAKIPTPAEIKASDPLREATLHPCSQGVLGFELGGLLPLAERLNAQGVPTARGGRWPPAPIDQIVRRVA
jgi:hypothetical protein